MASDSSNGGRAPGGELDEWDSVSDLEAEVRELRAFRDTVLEALTRNDMDESKALAAIADEHSAALTVTAGTFSDLGETIDSLSRNAGEINSVSDETEDAVQDAESAAEEAVDEVHHAQQAVRDLSADLESLQSAVGEVVEMLDVIHRISEQTDMIALNASIEAARVGSDGDGFGVVADEVGALASESRTQADQIESIVESVQSELDGARESLDSVDDATTDATDAIERSLGELETIEDFVETTSSGVDEIATATTNQAERVDAVASNLMDAMNTANSLERQLRDLHEEVVNSDEAD